MKPASPFWSSLFAPALVVPALGFALLGAIGTFLLTESVLAALLTVVTCLGAASVSARLISQETDNVTPQLRHSEHRKRDGITTKSIYYDVLQESRESIEQLELEANQATRGQAELEAETDLRQNRIRMLEAALDCLDRPVLISDRHDRIQYCNRAAFDLFPQVDDQSRHPSPDIGQIPVLKELLKTARSCSAAINHPSMEVDLRVGETEIPYRATAITLPEANCTEVSGVVTRFDDIRLEREEQRRHAVFISSVCHELKTPIAGILAYAEMLLDGDIGEPEEAQEVYRSIEQQVERQIRMINNMLNLARIESGVIAVQRENCELNDLLIQAMEVIQPTAEEKQIRVVSELSDHDLAVQVDPNLFSQAIVHLLSNAVNYTDEGGEVCLRSRLEENVAVLEVRDDGIGIPEEALPFIFDHFYRVPENNVAAFGTGLGLSLVQCIVTQLHGGTISVESRVQEGTCFRLMIPLGCHSRIARTNEAELCKQ